MHSPPSRVKGSFASLTVLACLQDCNEVRCFRSHKFQLEKIQESREAVERLLTTPLDKSKCVASRVHLPAEGCSSVNLCFVLKESSQRNTPTQLVANPRYHICLLGSSPPL